MKRLSISNFRLYIRIRIKKIIDRNSTRYHSIDHVLKQKLNKHRPWPKRGLICFAPFTNLYFRQDGSIGVCCYNHAVKLGKYPENKLTEIWKGHNLKTLRKHIINDDLSNGCVRCQEQLRTGNIANSQLIYFDNFNQLKYYPTRMQFQLENTCNLECIMCNGYLSSSKKEQGNYHL